MKKTVKILILFIIVVISGCTKDIIPNSGYSCFTPPERFLFEIVDKTTGINLFTLGTFQSNQISITDLATNTKVPFTFISENGINIISIDKIGWKTEKVNYLVTIQEKPIFGLYVDPTRISSTCSYTKYNEILIKNAEFELNKTSGIYRILVP
jgi:hypothetical protein